ncbi:MBL fold metallo-hydrolase [Alkanindiges sp. WGS2144]|uniref:MBL fold metallo-hydrolase n=1 Tax=Alkanindiges sp. WGS2144 TaxID=3366808 RepID=UPI003752550E
MFRKDPSTPNKSLLGRLLNQPDPSWYTPVHKTATSILEISYLGTAGFVLKSAGRIIVLDPYVSRPSLWTTLTQPLVPDVTLVEHLIPEADDVLIGHAHYDHILDAPQLCRSTGARLIGSSATMMVGRAAGLPEVQLRETQGREDIECGSWQVRGLPSLHGKAAFGRVPLPGDMTAPPPWPPRFYQLKHGLVLNWLVDTGALKVVHIDSADFIEEELAGIQADIVCLCAIGRQYRPDYVKDVVRLLNPKWIIPCHWDTMMTPIHDMPDLLPQVDMPGMIEEIHSAGCEPVVMPILGKAWF